MFPIKYIDKNLVCNKDNEVFAYYELIPVSYTHLDVYKRQDLGTLTDEYEKEITIHTTATDKKTGEKMIVAGKDIKIGLCKCCSKEKQHNI